MKCQHSLPLFVCFVLAIVLLVGCDGSSVKPSATPTLLLETFTPIPPTATLVPPTATPVPTTGEIEGRVFRSDTDESIANAVVSLNDPKADAEDPEHIIAEAATNSEGSYAFADIEPGEYSLSVVLEVETISDSPCASHGPRGRGLGIMFLDNDMVGALGRRDDDSLVLSVGSVTVNVVIGELVQVDIDLYCP